MTDQDKIPRFPDGTPVYPLERPKRPALIRVTAFGLGMLTVFALIAAVIYMLISLAVSATAHADELPVESNAVFVPTPDPNFWIGEPTFIYRSHEECSINADLRVTGPKRAACIEKLSTALRLARAEQMVNEHVKRVRR